MGIDTETAVTTTSHRGPWWSGAWIAVLFLIGVVQVLRAQWFDMAVLFTVSAILCIDLVRGVSRSNSGAPRTSALQPLKSWPRWVWIAAAIVGVSSCLLPRQSLPMQLLISAVGVAVVAVAWTQGRGSRDRWPQGMRRLAWVWSGIIVLGCVWELSQFITGLLRPEIHAYALSNLLNPFIEVRPGQVAFVLLWLAFGVFLLRRGRR